MAHLNDHYLKLKAGYLFPEIGRRVRAFCDANPDAAARVIRCGIGDVTEPLPPAVVAALHRAADDMARRETFHGYGPEQGYEWLRHAIAENDYRAHGLDIADDEIFVSDGSKCDTGNILDILGAQNRVAITDPVYPVYVDTNVMAGHTGAAGESGAYEGIVYLPCHADNGFVPAPPREKVDVVYLCFPNNPTGAVATREQLAAWVAYAREHRTLILFDAAMRPTSPIPPSRIRSTKSPARVSARSSSAASRRTADSPARAAHSSRCPRACLRRPPPASGARCTRSGCGARRPSSTACRIWCNVPPKRSTAPKAGSRCARSSSITWATRPSCAKPPLPPDCLCMAV